MSRGRSLLALMAAAGDGPATLPDAEAMPVRDAADLGAENIIGGQDAETTERLKEELRALGYIE